MGSIKLHAVGIKSIHDCQLELPFDRGIYALVGANGSGKSTIMLLLSQLVRETSLNRLTRRDYDDNSYVEVDVDGKLDKWAYDNTYKKWRTVKIPPQNRYTGFYEGSIFYGTRFVDATIVENLIDQSASLINNIVDADNFVKDNLSIPMEYAASLKRIKVACRRGRLRSRCFPQRLAVA